MVRNADRKAIMSAITFDTVKFVKTLKSAGFDDKQVEALAEAQAVAIDSASDLRLATKEDVQKINDKLNALSSDLRMIHITLGLLVVAVLIPTIKSLV
jgi:hypothetical protein